MTDAIPLPRGGERWALFLDIDGTLLAIAPTPEQVVVEPTLVPLLGRLQRRLGGALALVSGRPITAIDALFRPLRLPAAGLHGLERRSADGTVAPPPPRAQAIAALQPRLAAYAARRSGLIFEDKGGSLALHYRLAPRQGAAIRRLARRLAGEARGALRLIEGDHVVEFQRPGTDKGKAIAAFLAEPPFRGRRPVFAGDDTTDEDGFRLVTARRGIAIKVFDGGAPTAADYRVPDVAALRSWLEALAAALPAAKDDPERRAALPC